MRDKIGELWIQTRITTSFDWHLCVLAVITWKLQVLYGRSMYRKTALLLKMSLFCVRAGCEIRLASYGSKHSSQFLSDKPFCASLHALLENYRLCYGLPAYQMTAVLSELRQTCIGCSLIQHCVHILKAHIYITIWCTTTHDNKTRVPYDCILNTKWRLYCQRCIIL